MSTRIAALFVLPLLAFGAGAPADPNARAETDEAYRLLEAMTRAYRGARTIQQDTTFDTGITSIGSIASAKLYFQKPNRLLLEVNKLAGAGKGSKLTRVVCDGKNSYTYQEEYNRYMVDKAPRDVKGFQNLSFSIEIAIITGLDPFDLFRKQGFPMRVETPAMADNVMCDVVYINGGNPDRTADIRLYVGQQDHFLRRFTLETKLIPKPTAKKETPPVNTPLAPGEPPLSDDNNNVNLPAMRYAYENHITLAPRFASDTFKWEVPKGALLFDDTLRALDSTQTYETPGSMTGDPYAAIARSMSKQPKYKPPKIIKTH